ncbi:MAG: DUF1152 domain-containing protein [Chloroflexota bacterium]
MQIPLNLPILPQLASSQNILIAGAGGGFDVYVGLPIYYQLQQMGKTVHLANYSFSDTRLLQHATDTEVVIKDVLVGTRGNLQPALTYLPEAYLADWFRVQHGEDVTVWAIEKLGVPSVHQAYTALVDRLDIDAIILVDGGVDSLMRGDEQGAGTFLEDTISMTAVAMLDNVPVKLLAAIGIGTEVEEQVCHYSALENMAALIKQGAFYGSCALTPQMDAFAFYRGAAEHIFIHTPSEPSRIQSRIIPSVMGEFGSFNWLNHPRQPSSVFHSPLMGLYWFFDVAAVNQYSLVADVIRMEATFADTMAAFRRAAIGMRNTRRRQNIPLL